MTGQFFMLHIMKFDEVITWTFVQNLMESWIIKKRVDKNAFMAWQKEGNARIFSCESNSTKTNPFKGLNVCQQNLRQLKINHST